MTADQEQQLTSEQWPNVKHPQNHHILDNVHGHITLNYPLKLIFDTQEFQRLRGLKQLGATSLVYPSAVHTRFSHSFGTCYLADALVKHLRQYEELNITPVDHLSVCVAALCHDLGHGPFSHMYDEIRRSNKDNTDGWSHEQGSIEMLNRIFARPTVREAFEPFFGSGKTFERNLLFVCELIHSERFDEKKNWIAKGRSADKSFLYDIVANTNDKIDVDKWDYLLRDSKNCGISIGFNKDTVERLITNARALKAENGFLRICYADKALNSIQSLFQTRQSMHEIVYQHKTEQIIRELIVQALKLADDYLLFYSKEGKAYKLSEAYKNTSAYLRTTDNVLEMVTNSTIPELQEARAILRRISERQLPQLQKSVQFTLPRNSTRSARDIRDEVKKILREKLPDVYGKVETMVVLKQADRGNGNSDPMERVLIFSPKANGLADPVPREVDEKWIHVNSSSTVMINTLLLYTSRNEDSIEDRTMKDQVIREFEKAVQEHTS